VAPKVREQSKARMKLLYQDPLGITRAVVRQAEAAAARARREPLAAQLSGTTALVNRVVAQTRARVLRGDIHFPGKVVSLFESHTEIIRKGKLAKPTEFGRLVKIQEAEAQFITDYAVCEQGQSERALWEPALDRHIALFDHPPHLAVADGGFASRSNEHAAQARGVRHVVLPRQARGAIAYRAGGPPLAHRQRRAYQRTQASPRAAAMSIPRPGRDATGGSGWA
jgi:IS5 family transposase